MPGLVPGIHVLHLGTAKDVDGRDKPGHDEPFVVPRMSDIGILNDPVSLALMALLLGSPGLALGALAGALIWRRRRLTGGALGALAGFGARLTGWLYFTGNL